MYRTRAIITRSRFETALDYKPRIFKVRKVSLYYKPLCSINRGLYIIKKTFEDFCKYLPYTHHHNPLSIWNRSWLQTADFRLNFTCYVLN